MLLLKRFEFDYRYMTYVKVNCNVDVPSTLQISEVCMQYISLFYDGTFLTIIPVMFSTCDQNQTYELYAVVDHFGDLRSGHYTATIKSQDDGKWYNFNDDTVTLVRLTTLTAVLLKVTRDNEKN